MHVGHPRCHQESCFPEKDLGGEEGSMCQISLQIFGVFASTMWINLGDEGGPTLVQHPRIIWGLRKISDFAGKIWVVKKQTLREIACIKGWVSLYPRHQVCRGNCQRDIISYHLIIWSLPHDVSPMQHNQWKLFKGVLVSQIMHQFYHFLQWEIISKWLNLLDLLCSFYYLATIQVYESQCTWILFLHTSTYKETTAAINYLVKIIWDTNTIPQIIM